MERIASESAIEPSQSVISGTIHPLVLWRLDLNNTPSKVAASVVLMVVFLIDALLYIRALAHFNFKDLINVQTISDALSRVHTWKSSYFSIRGLLHRARLPSAFLHDL